MNQQLNEETGRWWAMCLLKMNCLNDFVVMGCRFRPQPALLRIIKVLVGAVLHPSINAFQLTEIASLNNRVFRTLGSLIVIAHTGVAEIKLQESDDYFVTVDQLDIYQENIASVCYRIADERIHFASYRHYAAFWHRVKDAFIGED